MDNENHNLVYATLLEIKSDIGELKADMKSVKEQTFKTNGRVTALEGAGNDNKVHWAKIGIYASMIGFVGATAISYLTSFEANVQAARVPTITNANLVSK